MASSEIYAAGDSMRFSNDCKFFASQIPQLAKYVEGEATRLKLQETKERLQQVSDSWYEMTLVSDS